MPGIFSPVVQGGGGFSAPIQQTSGLEAVAGAVSGITGFGGALIDQFAREQRQGSGGDSEARLKREALERTSAALRTAQALREQGRTREADSLASNAITNYTSSFGTTEALESVVQQFTGKTVQFNTMSPEDIQMASILEDPEFDTIYFPAAYGQLAQQGIEDPSQEEVLNLAMNIALNTRVEKGMLERTARQGQLGWVSGGEDSAISILNTQLNSMLGQVTGLQRQGQSGLITPEVIIQAENQFAATVANLRATVPVGADTKRFDAVVESTKKVFETLRNAPGNTVSLMRDTAVAGLTRNMKNGMDVVLASALLDSKELLGLPGAYTRLLDLTSDMAWKESSFNYFSNQPDTGGVSPLSEGSASSGFSYGELFPPNAPGVTPVRSSPKSVIRNMTGATEALNGLNIKTDVGRNGAARLITQVSDLMANPENNIVGPKQVRSTFNPKFWSALNEIKEANPAEFNVLSKQVHKAITRTSTGWMARMSSIGDQNGFLVDTNTGGVTADLQALRNNLSGNFTPMLKDVEKHYGGDWDAMLADGGQRLGGNMKDVAYARLSSQFDAWQQVKTYGDAVKWANTTIATQLKPKIEESDGPSIGTKTVKFTNQMTQEEYEKLPSGTRFEMPDGTIRVKN